MNPNVFVSHASEDKNFVLDFAAKLRSRRIDARKNRWKMLP